MTDRELLELAAKAAELPECGWMGPAFMYVKDNQFTDWNPLTDDGDALRLAVKLKIQITPGTYNKDEFTAFKAAGGEAHEYRCYQQDEFAATRRAITRAAAEIGKAK
jgi:hypothetical protein